MNRDRVRRYVERHDDPTVPQVLGRFELAPSTAEEVRELLDPNNRARARQGVPQDPTEGSCGSQRENEGQEEENRNTEVGLLRLLRVNGENDTPSPEIRGGGGQRARVVKADPEKSAENEVIE